MDTEQRGLVIYFCDGSKLHIDFPVQAPNETAAIMKLEEILKQRQIIAEVDGGVVIIPFDNIKYMKVYPDAPPDRRMGFPGDLLDDAIFGVGDELAP